MLPMFDITLLGKQGLFGMPTYFCFRTHFDSNLSSIETLLFIVNRLYNVLCCLHLNLSSLIAALSKYFTVHSKPCKMLA